MYQNIPDEGLGFLKKEANQYLGEINIMSFTKIILKMIFFIDENDIIVVIIQIYHSI